MICVVWCLSALVSLPTLLYPPWRIPFKKPSNTKIYLHEQDRIFLNSINGTKELAHHKCSVSFLHSIHKCEMIIMFVAIIYRNYYNFKFKQQNNNILNRLSSNFKNNFTSHQYSCAIQTHKNVSHSTSSFIHVINTIWQ